MRTNIEIDDHLMAAAMKVSGRTTKKATVEDALRVFVRSAAQRRALDEMRGMGWEGDLEKMRNDWSPDVDWGR